MKALPQLVFGVLALAVACGRSPQKLEQPTVDSSAALDHASEMPLQVTDLVTLAVPSCTYADACSPHVMSPMECTRVGDCTFYFALPIMPYISLDLDGTYVPRRLPSEQSGWDISADSHSVLFIGPTCESVRAQLAPQLHITSIHSCLP